MFTMPRSRHRASRFSPSSAPGASSFSLIHLSEKGGRVRFSPFLSGMPSIGITRPRRLAFTTVLIVSEKCVKSLFAELGVRSSSSIFSSHHARQSSRSSGLIS
ncbi:hypothetical protein A9O63_13050 [Cereibacter johrii]|nr:hypothetical protein A9O63_13050 [Cereibacter johrii]